MIAVLNLGISNLSSVVNALNFLNIKHLVTNEASALRDATHLILPGVGSFEAGMRALSKNGLDERIRESVLKDRKHIMGICLGLQLLFEESEESPGIAGLSILEGRVELLKKSIEYPLPRIGWCESEIIRNFLSYKTSEKMDFYYIHSYHVVPSDPSIAAITSGKTIKIISGIHKEQIYGVQFHPEKSHLAGFHILSQFAGSCWK